MWSWCTTVFLKHVHPLTHTHTHTHTHYTHKHTRTHPRARAYTHTHMFTGYQEEGAYASTLSSVTAYAAAADTSYYRPP